MKLMFYIMTITVALLSHHVAYSERPEFQTDISQEAKPPTIKVLLSKNRRAILLEAKGSYKVYNPINSLLLSSGTASKRDYVVFSSSGIKWAEQYPDISSIRIVPENAQSTILVDGIEYRGCVEIHAKEEGLSAINEIDIERYLKSTLVFSVSEEYDDEVLEAIAIIARTHAHYLMNQDPNTFFHVDAKDVGYEGNALTLQNLEIQQALNNTRHIIMTFQEMAFPATWTKDSAGKTADYARVFRKKILTPPGISTPIALKEREKHMWYFEISKKELAHMLGLSKITDIGLFQDKDSHKIYALRFKNGEHIHNIDFFTLQKTLHGSLKSNDFIVEVNGDKLHFTGYGEGHGVGLCLLSASYYADKGESAQQILARFFPDTKLKHPSNQ